MGTLFNKKIIYTLESPIWLHKAGMTKGLSHDRQHLGFILSAKSDLQIRQVNDAVDKPLTLRLLNTDSKTEKSFSVGHEWITVNNSSHSVPFIDTPYFNEQPMVEYRYPEGSKVLPVYCKFDDETAFFEQWDHQGSEFSVICSDYFLMLVPQQDKGSLQQLRSFKTIDELIDHYEKAMIFYNDLAGISFYPKRVTDKNIHNKYFIKADQHGIGAAYYGGSWTAANSSSIADFWLNDIDHDWGHLHEIAHGYQGTFMDSSAFSVGEVWNNIYAASYQDIYFGKEVFKKGWLYSNSTQLFKTVKEYLERNTPVDNWDLRSKLYFMMLMKDKAGNEAFRDFNQQYRKLCYQTDFTPGAYTLLDKLADSYSEIGRVDIIPFIKRVGGMLSTQQSITNTLNHAKAVYPLCELVNPERLQDIQDELKLPSPLSLVDPLQLKGTGLLGNLDVTINIDKFEEIYAETLLLMEGEHYALREKITQPFLQFSNIPVGAYTLLLPTGKGIKYSVDVQYGIVKQGANKLLVNYHPKLESVILSQEFSFWGLGDNLFATLSVDYLKKNININVTKSDPHSYFDKEKYVQVIINNQQGGCVFYKEIQGTHALVGMDQINFNLGDQLELFHAEPHRLKSAEKTLLSGEKLNSFTITSLGLQNNKNCNNPATDLNNRLEAAAQEIIKNPQWINCKYMPLKDEIYLAIKNYPEPERSRLLDKYKEVIPGDNQSPGEYVGNVFNMNLLGISDRMFFSVNIDRIDNTITFESKKGEPHYRFENTSYAVIRYVNSMGIEQYQYDFIGDKDLQATKIQFPLSYKGGERLFVHHKEPNRYKLYNAMQNKPLPPILSEDKLVNTTYRFGYNGLSVLNSHSPDALSLSDTAAGLSQAMAASELTSEIHCNLENVGASFFTQAPVPSSSPRSDRHNPW